MINTQLMLEMIKEKGLTEEEFAEKIGLTVHGLKLVIGARSTTLSRLQKIAGALGIRIETLIAEEELRENGKAENL